MRLKSLEIKGFKSFPNETILNFNENVIGIVGPNGSGKSNIVDAVRWVLGEQKSRELRLERMGDVLFNGSKTRKKSPMAQVSLIFDNTKNIIPVEYDSVKISRLLYRNGDSEYRLNNVACRLKDITNLFIDTGIGSDSYAIIALGMVDDILSDKDNARRKMFEQASGVAKFKIRKKEALSKLKITEADLERVQDLLYEIESNLKMLEKQARRARKYKKLKEQYKEISVTLSLAKMNSIDQKKTTIESQITEQKNILRDVLKKLRTKEAKLQKEKATNISSEQHLSSAQKELNEIVRQIQSGESEKALIKNKVEFAKEKIVEYKAFIERSNTEIANINELLDLKEKEIQTINADLAEKKTEFDDASGSYHELKANFDQIKNLIDSESRQKQELISSKADQEKQAAISMSLIENLESRIRNSEEKEESVQQSIAQSKTIEAEVKKKLKEAKCRLDKILVQEEKSRENQKKQEDQLKQLQSEHDSVRRKFDAKENEIKLLKSMVESLEGFPDSVKYVHQEIDGDLELLSDVLEVSDECKAALESYLSPYLNHFVVDDIKTASMAIGKLSEAQRGKASFFILDRLESVKEAPVLFNGLESVFEHVKAGSKYRSLMNLLLGHVYFTDLSLSEIRKLDLQGHLVVISKNGEFILRPEGLTGGSVGLFEGQRLGRKKNLEKITQSRDELKAKQNQLEELIRKIKLDLESEDVESVIESKEEAKSEIRKLEKEEFQHKLSLQTAEKTLDELLGHRSSMNERRKEEEGKLKEIEKNIKGIQNALALLNEKAGDRQDFNLLSEELSRVTETYNRINIEYIQVQNKLDVASKEYQFQSDRKSDLEKSLNEHQKAIEQEKKEIDKNEVRLKELDKELENLYSKKTKEERQLSEKEQSYFEARAMINEMEEEIRQLARKEGDVQNLVNALKEKLTSLQFEGNGIYERLNIEFGIKRKEILEFELPEKVDEEELTDRKEKLQQKIFNFGEVNPMAIEAYEEIAERHHNISSQRDDILTAKDSLVDTIKEIEVTAGERFMESFEQIRSNFQEIFRTLFTEDDNCDLVLLDDADPLESPIEIIAKPKGKKPKSISLLSGGEKTLTATALLFALYLLKPAPFCIFDEVDAPLDDANIQKFNRIIKKFSEDSQFIIVTHNKSTMAEVDVLYGVYMQEPGISAVSPVDFRTYQHEALLEKV